MINTQDKLLTLLFSAFIVLILGIVLIQSIGDEVELVKTSSNTVINETLSFVAVTSAVLNESVNMTNGTIANLTGKLNNDNLTALSAIRNSTSENLITFCNVTLYSGAIACNYTGYPANLYFDYTYISRRTETLANDEIISLDAIRNATSPSTSIIGQCNITLSTGALICNNTHYQTAYADYKYEPDTYVHSGAARTLLTLVVLFFALGILAVGIGYAIKSFKEGNVM